jgi:predicted MPP superfamily phosphohydrolase
MKTFLKILLALVTVLNLGNELQAQNENPAFSHTIEEELKPWTNKPFYNNPDNFQFAIVSDRTGGHREGVFGKGVEKINLLYPEFVMSVGDLIEGYSKDNTLLNAQWKEFDSILKPLATRFFYVAGNHDYSNEVMAQQWKERYGKDYYHFTYKEVLFLILNSNDGDGVVMGKNQIAFLKEAIAQNTNVRWTMVFMHHPMWAYGDASGFDEVEAALSDRKYTVFAGHTHRYMFDVRNDQNHYVLATTGGGSRLRGPKFGEFDQIGWVTMTDKGPKLVNLALSGIHDHDVSTQQTKEQAVSLIKATDFKTLVMAKERERKAILLLNNTSNKPIHFKGQLYHHHQVKADSSRFQLSLPPMSSSEIIIKTNPLDDAEASTWDPLELEWEMGYDNDFMEPEFSLNGTEIIELTPTQAGVSLTEQDIFVQELQVALTHPYKNISAKFTLDGSAINQDSPVFPENLTLDKTTIISLKLTDSEGFESAGFQKTYEKVKPAAATRKPRNAKKGLQYTYYEGNFDSIPDFSTLKALKSGSVTLLDPDAIGERLDHYAIQYKGFISVPETGIYTFYLRSDDGSKLYLDGDLLINNDGSHDTSTKTGMKALKKGMHPVQIDYFEDFLGEHLQLDFSGPNMERSPAVFWH